MAGPGIGPDKQRFSRAGWFGPSVDQAVVSGPGPALERLRCGDGRLPPVSAPFLVDPRVLPRSLARCFQSVGGASFAGPGIGPDKQRPSRADWFGPSVDQAAVSGPVLERLRCGDALAPHKMTD